MKKTLVGIVAIALMALMIANAYAVTIPAPDFGCGCRAQGFTPGFWKHNIQVRLGLTNGAYSAFEGGPRDGEKLTNAMMDGFLADINAELAASFTFAQLLAYLQSQGWDPNRTNTANWFNWAAGYGPY